MASGTEKRITGYLDIVASGAATMLAAGVLSPMHIEVVSGSGIERQRQVIPGAVSAGRFSIAGDGMDVGPEGIALDERKSADA